MVRVPLIGEKLLPNCACSTVNMNAEWHSLLALLCFSTSFFIEACPLARKDFTCFVEVAWHSDKPCRCPPSNCSFGGRLFLSVATRGASKSKHSSSTTATCEQRTTNRAPVFARDRLTQRNICSAALRVTPLRSAGGPASLNVAADPDRSSPMAMMVP